jgi:hypothetical protein
LELIFTTSSIGIIAFRKGLLEEGKAYYGLENNCKSTNLCNWDKKKLLFETLVILFILYGCEVWSYGISCESWRKIEKIQKKNDNL